MIAMLVAVAATIGRHSTHVIGAVLVLVLVLARFLLALEAGALPEQWRMRGVRKYVTWFLCLTVMGFGLYMVPSALGWT